MKSSCGRTATTTRHGRLPRGGAAGGTPVRQSSAPSPGREVMCSRIAESHLRRGNFDFRSLCLLPLLILPAILGAEDLQVVAKRYYGTFSAAHPVLLRIKPGDVVSTRTIDAFGYDEHGEVRGPDGNPLTGPFFVDGAEVGDAVLVHLRKLELNRNWGAAFFRLGVFSVIPEYVETMSPANIYPDRVIKGYANLARWDIDVAQKLVRLRDPKSGKQELELAAHPMLGCIGVAPEGDFVPTAQPAGRYGGNLDYNEVREGTTVLLPVYHPGGLLYIGDAHALQGDGEPVGSGIETSLNVEFSVEVAKQAHLTGPRLETADYLISVGAQPEFVSDLNHALQVATTDMVQWLIQDYKLDWMTAHALVAFQGKYDVITVAGCVGLRIPKRSLPAHK